MRVIFENLIFNMKSKKPSPQQSERPPDNGRPMTAKAVVWAVFGVVIVGALVSVAEMFIPAAQAKESAKTFMDVAKMAISGLLGFLAGRYV